MGEPQTGLGKCWRWAALAVLLVGVWLRVRAFSPLDIGYADELMQYLEQGSRLVTGHGVVPWEYRYGARNALVPQLLVGPLWLGHWLAPGTLWPVWLARGWFAALCALAMPAAWRLGALTSPRHGLVALLVVAVWWESVLFSELLLSESLATVLLLGAAALLLDGNAQRRGLVVAGLLLGLAVLVRLQYAVFAGVLVVSALRLDWRRWRWVLLGGAVAALVGAVSDLSVGRIPFAWVLVNFGFNIGSGRAARFGIEPPWWFLSEMAIKVGPAVAPFVLAAALWSGARYRPLLLAGLANLVAHSMVTHKEYRFVWATVLSLLVLAAIGSVRLADRLAVRRRAGAVAGLGAVAVVCASWVAVSLLAERATGGYASERGGGAIARLAIAAAQRPGICGIAVPDPWRAHVVPALLPREVPLSVVPLYDLVKLEAEVRPLPAELAGAANALITQGGVQSVPGGYRKVRCERMPQGEACLFIRPGSCAPAPRYSYQQALEREGL